jgi:hypothetical protein
MPGSGHDDGSFRSLVIGLDDQEAWKRERRAFMSWAGEMLVLPSNTDRSCRVVKLTTPMGAAGIEPATSRV